MNFVRTHKGSMIIWTVVVLIVVLRLVPISSGDFYSDNALNSFRAYGWFDFLGNNVGQSTPFNWLGYIPAWGNLSFHDAPPMAFAVQRVFFGVFGDSAAAARLPFVLAGIVSIFLVYFFLKKMVGRKVAMIAAMLYAASSYAAWAGQAGYLEGIGELFIVGSVLAGGYLFLKIGNDIETGSQTTETSAPIPDKKAVGMIYLWSIFTACALLTKYTAIFLIPPILISAFMYRKALKRYLKHAIIAAVLFVVLLSPVVFYNAKVYRLRGHFDAALSSMVGMHPDDFKIISERGISSDPIQSVKGIFLTLSDNTSYPLVFLFLACLLVVIWQVVRSRNWRSFESWILANSFFLVLMFSFAGGGVRFLSIAVPFMVIVTALGIVAIGDLIGSWAKERAKGIWPLGASSVIVVAIFSFEAFYSFNTNVLKEPIGPVGWLHSENKVLNLGFNQLDDFIRSKIIPVLPEQSSIRTKEDTVFTNKDVEGRSAIIYDDRIDWFAQMWYFQRFFLFYRWPVISTAFLTALNENTITIGDLMEASGRPLYFIYPIDQSVIDKTRQSDSDINVLGPALAERFDKSMVSTTTIYNSRGTPVFRIYEVPNP